MDGVQYGRTNNQTGDYDVLTKFLGVTEKELERIVREQIAHEEKTGVRLSQAEMIDALKRRSQEIKRPKLKLVKDCAAYDF